MKRTIKKAVIPVAGLGTRFLPVTKTVPKELLPIVDRPILHFIVEECVRAGIEDIIFITGRGKTAIEDYFDTSFQLETTLSQSKKLDLLDRIVETKKMANIISVRQKEPLGLGHAVSCAQPVVGNEPFAVLLGDEVMVNSEGQGEGIGELCSRYEELEQSIVAVMKVEPTEVEKYGIVDGTEEDHLIRVKNIVEKPARDKAPSCWALPGRYVFQPKLFDYLKDTKPGKNGEIQLTDGMCRLAERPGLWATQIKSQRFDAGDKFGYLLANLEIGLLHPEVGPKLKQYLKQRPSTL
ncbi:MAG: UTP--glucose-1-phosphate uridylyltransferase GalU [Bdellovibrionales bacterium]|nr:UTP--glucose-1-phosphate uridylyltransferase GalU [Bdellovibrionales bacterium]